MTIFTPDQIQPAPDRLAHDLATGAPTDEVVFLVDLGDRQAEVIVSGTRAATGEPGLEEWIADQLNALERSISIKALRGRLVAPTALTG
jgi:hypothetical protein